MKYTRERVQEACDQAVQKWERVVKYVTDHPDMPGVMAEGGARDCTLCDLFNIDGASCEGCPIKEFTGQPGCQDTPYDQWIMVRFYKGRGELKLERATAELQFIRQIAAMYRQGGRSDMKPKIDEMTAEALAKSIEKWQRIVKELKTPRRSGWTTLDQGAKDCPLCALYYEKLCVGCPIATDTSHTSCLNTPYQAWLEVKYYNISEQPRALAAAQAELDYLIDLQSRCEVEL